MSHDQVGEKEKRLRELKEIKFAGRRATKPPSAADLRKSLVKVKPAPRKGARRGR